LVEKKVKRTNSEWTELKSMMSEIKIMLETSSGTYKPSAKYLMNLIIKKMIVGGRKKSWLIFQFFLPTTFSTCTNKDGKTSYPRSILVDQKINSKNVSRKS
jgi:hypothetical protein